MVRLGQTGISRLSFSAAQAALQRRAARAYADAVSESRRGVWLGASAYLTWGFFPLYWPLLKPAGALEILAHRVVWALVLIAIMLLVVQRWSAVRAIMRDRRRMIILVVAAITIAINWGTYIWGVNNGHVVETSLGYFINPLVTVVIGVVILGERLRPVQWGAIGLAAVAVVELTIDYGRLPYIALVLAFSFGTYGLMKKQANLPALEGLALETILLAPIALVYLGSLQATGGLVFGHDGWVNAALLAGTGVMTAFPLLMFAGAATRVPLTTLGLLQYLTPTLQFILGLVVFHEEMTGPRWLGFVLIWAALAIITGEAIANRRKVLRQAAESVAY